MTTTEQRERWREKARRREARRLAELGEEGRRAFWREKSRRLSDEAMERKRDAALARRRARGDQPFAAFLSSLRTIVGIGPRACERCRTPFTPVVTSPGQRFCSARCRRRRDVPQVRIRGSLRSAILREAGWTCYLCGREIDQALRGPHPLSASIDHVKPLAQGGTNDRSNLRAAHLACNVEKGADLPPWWVERSA